MTILTAKENEKAKIVIYDRHIPPERLEECIREKRVYVLKNDSVQAHTEKDAVVGVLRYSLFWQTIPFLDLLYLDESFRNQGHGSTMIKHWEENMKQHGYRYVLTSTQADESAYLFYEKLGYRKIGSFLPPDQEAEEWIYGKSIE